MYGLCIYYNPCIRLHIILTICSILYNIIYMIYTYSIYKTVSFSYIYIFFLCIYILAFNSSIGIVLYFVQKLHYFLTSSQFKIHSWVCFLNCFQLVDLRMSRKYILNKDNVNYIDNSKCPLNYKRKGSCS